jgi:uncharacterized membrane protein
MNGLIVYLVIGTLWALVNEAHIESNGHRMRLIFLWPVTVTAFIIGVISAMNDRNKDDYDEEM